MKIKWPLLILVLLCSSASAQFRTPSTSGSADADSIKGAAVQDTTGNLADNDVMRYDKATNTWLHEAPPGAAGGTTDSVFIRWSDSNSVAAANAEIDQWLTPLDTFFLDTTDWLALDGSRAMGGNLTMSGFNITMSGDSLLEPHYFDVDSGFIMENVEDAGFRSYLEFGIDQLYVGFANAGNVRERAWEWAIAELRGLTPSLGTPKISQNVNWEANPITGTYIDAQTLKGNHIDSVSQDFVFDEAYKVTSAVADSAYATEAFVTLSAGGLTFFTEADDNDTSVFTATSPNTTVGFNDDLTLQGNDLTGVNSVTTSGAASGTFTFTGATSGSAAITVADVAGSPSEWLLPTTDGSNGNQLTTDGSGALSWAAAGGAGGSQDTVYIHTSADDDSISSVDNRISLKWGSSIIATIAGDTATAGVADQGITATQIDSTSNNVAFDEAFHILTTEPDSAYVTANTISDSLLLALLKTGGTMGAGATIAMNDGHITGADVFSGDTLILGGHDTLVAHEIAAYVMRREVHNASGATLVKGTPVYISGATGDVPNVDSARADNAAMMPALGLLETDIANGSAGHVVNGGALLKFNTSGPGWSVGDELYVGATGGLTSTKPTGTNLIQKIGIVTRVNATQGNIFVAGAGRSNDIPNIAEANFWVGNASGVATPVSMSGDASMIADGTVTIDHGDLDGLADDDHTQYFKESDTAAFAATITDSLPSKVDTTLTDAFIFVGNATNAATGVAVSGDMSITNAGVVAIANDVIDSTNVADGDLSIDDINWDFEWIYLQVVHGFGRALTDSIYLSFPMQSANGDTCFLLRDSAGNITAGDDDTVMVSGFIPYDCTLDSLEVMYMITTTSEIVDYQLRGPDLSAPTNLCDSAYETYTTDLTSTSWDTAQLVVDSDIAVSAGDRFAFKYIVNFDTDNNNLRIGWIRVRVRR